MESPDPKDESEPAPRWAEKLLRRLRILQPSTWRPSVFWWVVALLLPALSVVAVIVLRSRGTATLNAFNYFLDNLPLMLPVLTVVLSVMLRPDALTKLEGWLGLCNALALGFVSFAIWAFVAGRGVDQYIRINSNMVLNRDHSLLLVFWAFIWAGFCSVVSALAHIGEEPARRRWQILQAVLVAISLAFLFMPAYLFEDKATVEARLGVSFDERLYTVSIPYRDAALNQHLGRSADPLLQAKVFRGVAARNTVEAKRKALAQFRDAPEFYQFQRTNEPDVRRPVEVLDALVVASIEDGAAVGFPERGEEPQR